MKKIIDYIKESFKINSKTLNYYKFEDEGLEEDIGIYLPFKIILQDQQESEEIYKIEYGKGNSGKSFWKFYDDEGNLVMGLPKSSIIGLFQKKSKIYIIIINLHGEKYGRAETIYIDKKYF